MIERSRSVYSAFALVFTAFFFSQVHAQSAVEQNSNVVGMTPEGHYRGIPAMQDNEPSCAINPILPRNIVCAWNGSGGSDDLIGDTWIRFSESIDGGRTFFNRYLNGSNLNLATSVGQQFGADPVMMCWPGGCGTVMLASTRGEAGGTGGGIYMQMMADFNTETGFRKALNVNLDQIYRSTGSHFADKPHALYILDEENPGVVNVTMTVEKPAGGTELITRAWPKARIIVVFALFNSSKNDIEILSTHTDDYGSSWSNPKQIAVTSGRDQGVSVAAIGDTVFYGFRRFAQGTEPDSMMGVVVTRDGTRIGKPFEIAPPICAYDVPTLPSSTNSTAAAARTNDFPWVSQNGSNFIMVWSERKRGSNGTCLNNTDSRIMASVGSANGRNWSSPVEAAPSVAHGFQFMPTVECSLGVCQIAWWDTRRDSKRTREFLQNGGSAQQAALVAFENLPIFADFQFPTGNGTEVIQFKRTADMFTKKFEIAGGALLMTPDEPVQASRYRLGLYNGEVVEREFNPFHVKAYKTNTVPFAGDYNSLTSVRHRFVFDPEDPSVPPFWQENASPNPLDPNSDPLFWLSWTDSRNMRGQLYTAAINASPPYARTPAATMVSSTETNDVDDATSDKNAETLAALSVDDANPSAMSCNFVPAVPREQFIAVNNRTKDADIYGALIENRVNAWSLNPTKTLGQILRTYTIVAENEDDVERTFRFEIANQPAGFPLTARASWDQLPFDPTDPAFRTVLPDEVETETVGPRSSVSVALFLISVNPVNPVAIQIFDDATDALINTITVNGSIESGPLLSPDGTLNNFERHNPIVYAPDQFNPDQYNPDQYNPDQFNPDLYNPDQYNPDQYNPDQFNPDQYNPDQFNPDQYNPDQFNPDQYNPDQFNPDQFNPDQFNPDQFNPDQFNPDQYNPDQYNSALTDSDTLHNPELPKPTSIVDADGNPVELVVRLDVNFGIQNDGNTLTPYSVDFALADDEVLALIASGQISTQLIAWQDKQISDVQFCELALISENRVIAAVNNPDLTQLTIPDINNNRVGALTYFITPGDILQNTLRFIGPEDKIQILADALANNIISYVFASQAANTDEYDLGLGREQVVVDRTPPKFNRQKNDISVFEATEPGGALLPVDWVTASKDGETIATLCTPALGTTIGLDLDNGGMPTALSCEATSTSNNVTAYLNMFVSVEDTQAPSIDPGSVQTDLLVEANVANGAMINYSMPTATDADGVDTNVAVDCFPASGSTFPFSAPSTTSTVTCLATDDSGNTSGPESFTITVEDTSAPTIDPSSVPADVVVEATGSGGAVATFGTPTASDFGGVDTAVDVSCTAASGALFPLTITTVSCTATDDSGNASVPVSFTITVQDTTAPTFAILNPPDIIAEATQSNGGVAIFTLPVASDVNGVDPNVNVTCSATSGSLFSFSAPGPTTTVVSCTAMDDNNNVSDPVSFNVVVRDTQAPVINPLSIPANIVAEATQANGAFITFTNPFAADVNGVDTMVDVSCSPASGSLFDYSAPGPTTTPVLCTAVDDSANSSSATFNVAVQDTSAPVLDDISPPIFDQTEPFKLLPGANTFRLVWGPFGASDPDPNLVVSCNVGTLVAGAPLYTFAYDFGVGTTTVICTATDSNGNASSGTFDVTILDETAPVITLNGDAIVTLKVGPGPYVDAGATALDNGNVDVSGSITIDSSAVDTTKSGTYLVTISAADGSGNTAQITRTVIVEFAYFGWTGIIPTKTSMKVGSSNPLLWAWLDEIGNTVDSSGDVQLLRIQHCATGVIVLQMAGDPGSSGFRFKTDGYWQFNWDSVGIKGQQYCAVVESGLTGQSQSSPPIRLN